MAETNKSGANPNSFPTLCDVMQGLLQRDAECAARWQVEKHLPRLPCSDGLPDGVVWTVQPFWSHHPRYPLPEVRVAAPSVEGDFRDAPQQHIMQLSCWMRPTSHSAALELLDAPQQHFNDVLCVAMCTGSVWRLLLQVCYELLYVKIVSSWGGKGVAFGV